MENPIITEKKYIKKKTEIKEEKEKDDLEEINIEKQILRTGSFTQKTLSNRKRSFRTRYSISNFLNYIFIFMTKKPFKVQTK